MGIPIIWRLAGKASIASHTQVAAMVSVDHQIKTFLYILLKFDLFSLFLKSILAYFLLYRITSFPII